MKQFRFFTVWAWIGIVCGMLVLMTNCQKLEDPVRPPPITGDSGPTSPYPVDPVEPAQATPVPGIPSGDAGWTLAINDSLMNTADPGGRTLAGGSFTSEGYFIGEDFYSYILYDTAIVRNIRVEFDAQGYERGEGMKGGDDQMTILIMHDAPAGTNWKVDWAWLPNYLFQFFKMANGCPEDCASVDGYKLKAGSRYFLGNQPYDGGEWKSRWGTLPYSDWNPYETYHWLIQVDDGDILIKRGDEVLLNDSTDFRPNYGYRVYIGGSDFGWPSPDNVTYSNVNIYRK